MLLHTEYAEVLDVGANALFPVKLRLNPALPLFTRRFEAQLHWDTGSHRRDTEVAPARPCPHPIP
jgi:hypothetical protein